MLPLSPRPSSHEVTEEGALEEPLLNLLMMSACGSFGLRNLCHAEAKIGDLIPRVLEHVASLSYTFTQRSYDFAPALRGITRDRPAGRSAE